MIFSLNGRAAVSAFGCVGHKRGAWHRGRVLDTHLILYVMEGTVPMQIGKETYRAEAGDILFIPRDSSYKPLISGGCKYFFFHFDMEESDEERLPATALNALEANCSGFAYYFDRPEDITLRLSTHFTPKHQHALQEIISRVESLDVMHHVREKMRLNLYFREFLLNLAASEDNTIQVSETTEKILRYISDHIRSSVALGDIADALYLSESYVARIFKKEMGMSVGTYITRQKMNIACALLTDSDIGVAEVARQTGYASPYYFSTTFTRHTGVSPSAYRRRR